METLGMQHILDKMKALLLSLTPWDVALYGFIIYGSHQLVKYIYNYYQYMKNKKLIQNKQAELGGIKANWSHQVLVQVLPHTNSTLTLEIGSMQPHL